jgi:bifunctional enzyme CysN/CysC
MKSSNAINQYLKEQASLDLLRFITCGSVDDGKSTLIGRMLYESQMIFDDQVASLKNDSKKHGTQGEDMDFALLVDGLSAEREQGITIDVAYRFFLVVKENLLWLIHLVTNSIPGIWQQGPQQLILLFF